MRSRNIFFLILILSSSNFVTVNAWEIDKVSSVIQVIDGDSFKIKSDEVRLADVSAPEWDQTGGLEATAALKSLIEDKRVYLDTDQKSGRDKYGRLIAVVYIKHNSTHYRNVNYILWKIRKIVKLDDYSNNEFDPSTWTKYLKYADSSPTPPSPAPKPQPPKEYTLSINIQGQGTINHPTESIYNENTKLNLTATPNKYWRLKTWILNGETCGNSTNLEIVVTSDLYLDLLFEEKPPNCRILFKVMDQKNHTIEGVTITSITKPTKQKTITLTSDESGFTYIDNAYWGYYGFNITKKGYISESDSFEIDIGEEKQREIVLTANLFDFKIQILDNEGNKLVNTTVRSYVEPDGQQPVEGTTDEEGTLTLHDLKPGHYIFEALGKYIETNSFEVYTEIDRTIEISFPVQILSDLRIRVEDEIGNPLTGVQVKSLCCPESQKKLLGVCDEEITFTRILPGDYRFRLSKEDYKPISFAISFTRGGLVDAHTIVLTPIPVNIAPYLVVSLFIIMLGVINYIASPGLKHSICKTQKLDSVEQNTIRHNPRYLDTDKGVIIETIYLQGRSTLDDIINGSNLGDDDFWDAFYELLRKKELETDKKGYYYLTENLKEEWDKYNSIK